MHCCTHVSCCDSSVNCGTTVPWSRISAHSAVCLPHLTFTRSSSQRLLDYITPDYVHVMIEGKIVQTGGKARGSRTQACMCSHARAPWLL